MREQFAPSRPGIRNIHIMRDREHERAVRLDHEDRRDARPAAAMRSAAPAGRSASRSGEPARCTVVWSSVVVLVEVGEDDIRLRRRGSPRSGHPHPARVVEELVQLAQVDVGRPRASVARARISRSRIAAASSRAISGCLHESLRAVGEGDEGKVSPRSLHFSIVPRQRISSSWWAMIETTFMRGIPGETAGVAGIVTQPTGLAQPSASRGPPKARRCELGALRHRPQFGPGYGWVHGGRCRDRGEAW